MQEYIIPIYIYILSLLPHLPRVPTIAPEALRNISHHLMHFTSFDAPPNAISFQWDMSFLDEFVLPSLEKNACSHRIFRALGAPHNA